MSLFVVVQLVVDGKLREGGKYEKREREKERKKKGRKEINGVMKYGGSVWYLPCWSFVRDVMS